MYLHRPGQGHGRLDNPAHYDCWYFTTTPEGAVGEAFGNLMEWEPGMFDIPSMPGGRRDLATYDIPDDMNILDLDDSGALAKRNLRPTQVISRNRSTTQDWALEIFREHRDGGGPKWAGVKWWSFHRPQWPILGIWVKPKHAPPHACLAIQSLSTTDPLVQNVAATLRKVIKP
jgi:hypothetical protein